MKQLGRGRGTFSKISVDKCLCLRPLTNVLCNVCGYCTWGRVRYSCQYHPQTVFLYDINQCPQCKSHGFMMSEI